MCSKWQLRGNVHKTELYRKMLLLLSLFACATEVSTTQMLHIVIVICVVGSRCAGGRTIYEYHRVELFKDQNYQQYNCRNYATTQ